MNSIFAARISTRWATTADSLANVIARKAFNVAAEAVKHSRERGTSGALVPCRLCDAMRENCVCPGSRPAKVRHEEGEAARAALGAILARPKPSKMIEQRGGSK